MNRLTMVKWVLAFLFATSVSILSILMGAQASDQISVKPLAMDHAKMDMADTKKTPRNQSGALAVSGAWARVSFGKAVNSAGFLTIKNTGSTDDMLIGASSGISKRTELHTHIRDGQIMRMRRVEGGIPVPKGRSAVLQPGGYHIMFIGLHKPLKAGETFPLTLKFKNAKPITIFVTAQKKAMPKGMMMMDHSKMDHGMMNHDGMKMDLKK